MAGITLGVNIASLAAQRGLGDATSEVTQAYTRLSSGMRINRASDDAAGLSISAALNASAKIFTQAIRNINDAVSATSISEAALGSLSDIALRQVELAEQAANGSYSFAQRKAMNREADALTDEFNRIIQSTTFNGIQLLSTFGTSLSIQAGIGSSGVITGTLNTALARGTGDGTFQSSISVAGLTSIQGISSGDFNGDGRLDFAISGGGRVSVRLGNGDGTFSSTVSILTGGGAYSALVGDINGDGKLDIVSPNSVGSGIYSMLGNGDGTFTAPVSYTTAGTIYRAAIGDVNRDGKLDVVSITGSGVTVSVSLGNGDGSFRAGVSSTTGAANTDSVTLNDFNNDGILDYALGDFSSGNILVHIGAGDGSFGAARTFNVGTASAGRISSGDLNHDGIMDLVSTDTTTNKTHVLLGNGNATFRMAVSYATNLPLIATIADFNGDGYNDIFVPDGGLSGSNVLINRGDGTFNAAVSYSLGATGTAAATGDFNGDGATDIATVTGSNSVSVLLGTSVKRTTIAYLDMFTQESARASLEIAKETSSRISQELGQIGAFTSRFDVALGNLESARENYLAAESRIKDADIAAESANLLRSQILQQAAVAVLAQANQAPQLALKLLSS